MLISSNNKYELLYLLGILNSTLNLKILFLTSNAGEHEQLGTLASITTIKNFIRVPILNTLEKEELKQKLIQKAQELLNCENIVMEELVDFEFDGLPPAKFNTWQVENNKLILDSYKFQITSDSDLVKQVIISEIGLNEFTFQTIKKLRVFDRQKQDNIKEEMDDIVLKLYEMEKWSDYLINQK